MSSSTIMHTGRLNADLNSAIFGVGNKPRNTAGDSPHVDSAVIVDVGQVLPDKIRELTRKLNTSGAAA